MCKKIDSYKNQIRVYALLVMVMICLIGSVPVPAQAAVVDGVEYDYVFTNRVKDTYYQLYNVNFTSSLSAYKPVLVRYNDTLALYFLSHEPFSYDLSHVQYKSDNNSYVYYNVLHHNGAAYEVTNSNGDRVHFYISSFTQDFSFWELTSGSYVGFYDLGVNADTSNLSQTLYEIYTGNTNIPGYVPNVPEFDGSTASLSSDIGYLQNVCKNELYYGSGITDYEVMREFTYNSLTSTGFNIQQDNVKIEARITVTGKAKLGSTVDFLTTLPLFIDPPVIPDYSESFFFDTDNLYADFDYDTLFSLFEKWKSQVTWYLEYEYAYNYAFRVCVYDSVSNSWKYGGWVKIVDSDSNRVTADDYVTIAGTEDEDGTFIPDNISSGNYDGGSSIGSGHDLDQARDNIVSDNSGRGSSIEFSWSGITDSIKDLLDNLASLVNSVGQFPSLFAKVFSFLPSHIINLIYAAIVMAVLLRLFGR